jgi:SAM-dependent methyltransferase
VRLPARMVQAARRVLGRRVRSGNRFRGQVLGRVGLEIGGPSSVFSDRGELPLYRYVKGLDNCVFSFETIWEGRREEGRTFLYHSKRPKGQNYVREGTDLRGISDGSYDFVLSCHNLEHIANPLKALNEWSRVTKPGGAIIVVLPHYRRTFDHRRRPTSVQHMKDDFAEMRDETDLTHLMEILELHDLSLDPAAGTAEHFRKRSEHNFENRCLHHHVFDETNARGLFEAAGLEVEIAELARPQHIAVLAHRPRE